ncbi:hypothetical protein SAMN05216570_0257 [Dyella sp. OK004]|uniref:hypothetical protein n=1 Tax=Dyella sp. OK004 TaxID=1855292 RepID=UPI0008EB46EB|nr:hypothetical protein [Dyella sp. OK004]SFR88109.1 hypothetical protein SAMN05216570_0257 [Dyella sp. OK004]
MHDESRSMVVGKASLSRSERVVAAVIALVSGQALAALWAMPGYGKYAAAAIIFFGLIGLDYALVAWYRREGCDIELARLLSSSYLLFIVMVAGAWNLVHALWPTP